MNEMTFYKAAERYERKLSDKGRACDANKRSVLKRLKSFIGDVPLSEIDRMLYRRPSFLVSNHENEERW